MHQADDTPPTDIGTHAYSRCCAMVAAQLQKAEEARRELLLQYDGKQVHHWRVSLRRAIVTVPLIAGCFPDHPAASMKHELKRWREATGASRDLDIFAEDSLPAFAADHPAAMASPALLATLEQQRNDARSKTLAALESSSLASLIAQFSAMSLRRPAPNDTALQHVADVAIERTWHTLVHRADRLDGGRKRLHRLRAAVKSMRYTVELFQPLYEPKPTHAWLDVLTDLQGDLGKAHDRMIARRIAKFLRGGASRDAFTKDFDRWSRHRGHRAAMHAETTCRHLLKTKPFWGR